MMRSFQKLFTALRNYQGMTADCVQTVITEVEQTSDLTRALSSIAHLSAEEIIQFYAQVLDLDVMGYDDLPLYPVSREVSLKFSRNHNVLPLETIDDQVRLVTATPYDPYPIQAISMACEKTVTLCLALPDTIKRVLDMVSADDATISELSNQLEDNQDFSEEGDIDRLKDLASEAPIVRLVNVLVAQAMELRASDIHIEPFEQKLRVRYRIDGVLCEMDSPPLHSTAAIISRVKIMAKLNIAERRLPQDGRIQMRLKGRQIDLRISTVPSLFGESVVIRILDKEQLNLSFDKLGFGDNNTQYFQGLVHRPHGIVLVTGPTGSGKTTTLYTALASLNLPDIKIMTVEDPIEYQLDGIMQMQVKSTIGLGFANALRAIVRQDPDIIMIGEMRDYETASIAIQSALTGHLVFSTLHTNDTGSAITRLLDMGVEDYLITSTVAGIIAQRLVRTLCPTCKKQVTPLPEVIAEFRLDDYDDTPTLFEPVGCDDCNGVGYKGRTVILEQMNLDDSLRQKILAHADGASLQAHALSNGMESMRADGLCKALSGVTSLAEVISATQDL
jgi:general secretion pathway protein E